MTESKPYKVYPANRGLIVSLPMAEARQIGIKAGDKITWTIAGDQLVVRKART